jgi:hypothetical protein
MPYSYCYAVTRGEVMTDSDNEKIAMNPGGDKAIKKGCTCPPLDNGHGHGRGDGTFWVDPHCKLHEKMKITPVGRKEPFCTENWHVFNGKPEPGETCRCGKKKSTINPGITEDV